MNFRSACGPILWTGSPVLVLILTAVGWGIRGNLQRRQAFEDQLRPDRIDTYNAILEPFILLLTTQDAFAADPANRGLDKNEAAVQTLLSVEYRKEGFRLALFGADAVVKTYVDLMQYTYNQPQQTETGGSADGQRIMELLGEFLLAIRRSVGNQSTKLDRWEMLEWFIKDIDQYRDRH